MELRQSRVAEEALQRVKDVAGKSIAKDYRSRADNFPTLVAQSGLAQALGFLKAKTGDRKKPLQQAYGAYHEDLRRVMCAGWPAAGSTVDALFERVVAADLATYQLYTKQALDAALWLKRMSQAYLEREAS
ncbi:MAG: type III-B CRISPR module-associated protein Cmr5 [bacterium]|nr:type III-B CRISPR module-associated protein Cmr5 [bacterium]